MVENKIVHAYEEKFGARPSSFMPKLVSAGRPDQDPHLIFGLASARDYTLFLENYLPEPIEQTLSAAVCSPIDRDSIVEIGSLVFTDTRTIQQDFIAIADYCHQQGYRYVVCTATRALRLMFVRAGMRPVLLGKAHEQHAPEDGSQWGNYYTTTPQIIGGNILEGLQYMQKPPLSV